MFPFRSDGFYSVLARRRGDRKAHRGSVLQGSLERLLFPPRSSTSGNPSQGITEKKHKAQAGRMFITALCSPASVT